MIDRLAEQPHSSYLRRIRGAVSLRVSSTAGRAAFWIGTALVAALIGREIALNDQIAIVLVVAVAGALAVIAPSSMWAIGALLAAIALRGPVTLGLPSMLAYLDIPLAWGALAAALVRRHRWTPIAKRHIGLLTALTVAVFFSWGFHRSELVRPVLYLALIGEPFALIGALVLDPPSARARKALAFTAAALVAVQVPISIGQASVLGLGDPVEGTLYGAGAGAHVMSGFVVLGALWLMGSRVKAAWRLPGLALLMVVPLIAQAKQILFVLPIGILAMPWGTRGRQAWILRGTIAAAGLLALFYLKPFANEAKSTDVFLREAGSGRTGKFAVARLVGRTLAEEPSTLFFGKGPAETVSRAAFMTTDLLLKQDSPLRMFHLKPAAIAEEAEAQANILTKGNVPGHGTSFNSGQTSALGVLGDLGLIGAATYALLLGSVFVAVRRMRSPEASAAAAGWAMFAVLGFIFDWWEQPPFTLFLAALTGLALSRSSWGSTKSDQQVNSDVRSAI